MVISLLSTILFIFIVFFTFLFVYYNAYIPKVKVIWVLVITTALTNLLYQMYGTFLNYYPNSLLTLSVTIFNLLFFSGFILKISVRIMLRAMLFTIFFTVVENLASKALINKFGMQLTSGENNLIDEIDFVSGLVFTFMIVSLSVYHKLFQKLPNDIKKVESKGFLINFFLIVSICLTNIFFWSNVGNVWLNSSLLVVNGFFLIMFLIVSVLNLYTYIKVGKTTVQIELHEIYNETMQTFMEEIKRIKHSYNNMLQPLSGYISLKKWDRIERYLLEVSHEFLTVDSFQTLMNLNVENAAILGLLNSKMKKAVSEGINFTVNSSVKFKNINLNMQILTKALGALIDNSIYYSKLSKEKIINIEINNENKELIFIIRNFCLQSFDSTFVTNEIYENSMQYIKENIEQNDKFYIDCYAEKDILITRLVLKNAMD